MQIYQKMEFDAAHRLYGYDGNCSNLHGHRWMLEIWLKGDNLDSCGMLVDYRDIKGTIKEMFDHNTILNINDPLYTLLTTNSYKVYGMNGNPTAENLAKEVFRKFNELGVVKVRIHESADNFAEVTEC